MGVDRLFTSDRDLKIPLAVFLFLVFVGTLVALRFNGEKLELPLFGLLPLMLLLRFAGVRHLRLHTAVPAWSADVPHMRYPLKPYVRASSGMVGSSSSAAARAGMPVIFRPDSTTAPSGTAITIASPLYNRIDNITGSGTHGYY